MMGYQLLAEQKKMRALFEQLPIFKKEEELFWQFAYILKKEKEGSLDEAVSFLLEIFVQDFASLLEEKITLGFEAGIKNRYYELEIFGGYQKLSGQEVLENTYFSFDSISKLLTSVVVYRLLQLHGESLETVVHHIQPFFSLDCSVREIMNFTAALKTKKRLDYLTFEEVISLLREVQDDLLIKQKIPSFYQYNDIGYLILRLSIPDFLKELDFLLRKIDPENLIYQTDPCSRNITGGRVGVEYITPDPKGRGIIYPGHTGLYGNIGGLLHLFEQILFQNHLLSEEDKADLFRQPYDNPLVYKFGADYLIREDCLQYTAKIAGIYRMPHSIREENVDRLVVCDFPNSTTNFAKASSGTCGSWVMGDDLTSGGSFGSYVGGILSNPYSFVEEKNYPEEVNKLADTSLLVNRRGIILHYPKKIDPYKKKISHYGILLELLSAYYEDKAEKKIKKLTRKV